MRKSKLIVCLVLILALLLPTFVCRADEPTIQVILDGKKMDFDVQPQIISDRTYVPMRAIFEALGATVSWDEKTNSVTSIKSGTEIVMSIGSIISTVNGRKAIMQAQPLKVEGRTLVPVRCVAESLGSKVSWDSLTRTVIISSDSSQSVVPSLDIDKTKDWKKIDTYYARVYYYGNEEYVKKEFPQITAIYEDVCKQFKHSALPSFSEEAKIPIFFLDDATFKKYLDNAEADAIWSNKDMAMFINMKIADIQAVDLAFEITVRHEFIHAVTLASLDTKVGNISIWFAEGFADYYETDRGYVRDYKLNVVKNAIRDKSIISWDKLDQGFYSKDQTQINLAYWESSSIVDFLIKKYGYDKTLDIFYTSADFKDSLQAVTSRNLSELESDWLDYTKNR